MSLLERLNKAVGKVLPKYLQVWTREMISELQQADDASTEMPVLSRSVNAMAKYFRKRDMEKPHCLTCGKLFASLTLVAAHLRDTIQCKTCKQEFESAKIATEHSDLMGHKMRFRSHIYGLKDLKDEVNRVQKLKYVANALGPTLEDSQMQLLLLLRVGIALKVATLVRLRGSNDKKRNFEKRVRKIVADL
jgi:hypothetical protein